MKKILALFLCSVMVLGLLAGCGGDGKTASASAPLQVGYGVSDVTPVGSVPLGGYGNTADRYSTGVGHPFHAVAVVFTDDTGSSVLYITLDLLLCYGFADTLRDVLSQRLDLTKDRIMIHCDHNHSGPDMNFSDPAISAYSAQLTNGVLSAADAAMADRKPVTGLETTFTRLEDVNFVRHYLLSDGNYQAEAVGTLSKDMIIGHATVADNLLQLARFTREGGKDVVLMNWQGHPKGTEPSTIATGNYYSVMRTYVNENLDCNSVFVFGGSGNLNNTSQIPGEGKYDDYIELGEGLGAAAVEAAKSFAPSSIGKVLIKENLCQMQGNSGMRTVPLYAMCIGDFAMVFAPFEIFDTNAMAVREGSDFKMTFYSSCSNKSMGYLPTPMSFDWEIAYEVRITNFPKGTAELVETELSTMLDALFIESGNQAVPKPDGYIRTPFVPATDGKTYQNPVPGKTDAYKAVNNGFYSLQLLEGAKLYNILTKDEALAQAILTKTTVQLIFNEQHVAVGIVE